MEIIFCRLRDAWVGGLADQHRSARQSLNDKGVSVMANPEILKRGAGRLRCISHVAFIANANNELCAFFFARCAAVSLNTREL